MYIVIKCTGLGSGEKWTHEIFVFGRQSLHSDHVAKEEKRSFHQIRPDTSTIFYFHILYILFFSLCHTFTTQSNASCVIINGIFIHRKHKHFISTIIFSRRINVTCMYSFVSYYFIFVITFLDYLHLINGRYII